MTQLNLPEEFVLLLHRPEGSHHACDHTGAAELGELVLAGHVEPAGKKVAPLTEEPVGTAWADEALDWLRRKGKPVAATTFIQYRVGARKRHTEALVERGLMSYEDKKFLFMPYKKYYPDTAARDRLIGRVRAAAHDEIQLDERLALLCALVQVTGLSPKLGLDREEQERLKQISKGEQLGDAVRDMIAQTTAAVSVAVSAAVVGGAVAGGN